MCEWLVVDIQVHVTFLVVKFNTNYKIIFVLELFDHLILKVHSQTITTSTQYIINEI